jgi:hypothetical protein
LSIEESKAMSLNIYWLERLPILVTEYQTHVTAGIITQAIDAVIAACQERPIGHRGHPSGQDV